MQTDSRGRPAIVPWIQALEEMKDAHQRGDSFPCATEDGDAWRSSAVCGMQSFGSALGWQPNSTAARSGGG
jgi:hypothetical protein